MCMTCFVSFFTDPLKLSIVIISIILALTLLVLFVKNKRKLSNTSKLLILYGSIFFFVFPVIFYIYGRACQKLIISCNIINSSLYSLPIALGISLIIGFISLPFMYIYSFKHKIIEFNNTIYKFIQKYSKKLNIKNPKTYVIDKVEPIAFSLSYISPKIFVSVGLLEILNKKEIEAVLLHELAHIKQKSSILKISNLLTKILIPFSNFYNIKEELQQEEIKADDFTVKIQNTSKNLKSAKNKIKKFYKVKSSIDFFNK